MNKGFSFIRLKANKRIKHFDCGSKDLNEFLLDDSINYLNSLLAVTYLIESPKETIAFFSLANDKITIEEATSKSFWKSKVSKKLHFEKRGLSNFPCVKLGRLGVHINYKRQGFGKIIIDWIKESFTNKNKTGCLFITVDAYNEPEVLRFYEANGFKFLNPDKDKSDSTRLMYYRLLENR